MPSGMGFRAWKNTVYQNINVASGRPDSKALEWAMQVEDESVPDEALHEVPRRFARLSQKLSAKFQTISQAPGALGGMMGKGGLGGQIALAVEQWLLKKKPAPGLVLLRIIIKYFATNRACEILYNINDLAMCKIRQQAGLSGFLNSWDAILQGMREPPNVTQLEFMFYEAIRLHPDVKEDIAHYDRLEEGAGGDRSYEFLYNCVCRAVRIKRMRENLYQQRKNIGNLPDVGNPNEDTRYMSSPNCAAQTNQQGAGGKRKTFCAYHAQGFATKGISANTVTTSLKTYRRCSG